ncbi:MAG: ribonuclease HII [Candidatus Nanohaloarchaea archaeon]|nr:ribonuclease HII [Candidatus Nanohaloarchaea archaeon]
MDIIGIDEAGRGPVIGSLFIGAVQVQETQLDALDSLGLKDSKKLSEERRRDLGRQVEDFVETHHIREITASEIDELRELISLNRIEIRAFAQLIQQLQPDTAYIDLPEPDAEKFTAKLRNELETDKDIDIIAEHKADDTYPIVSAASILAKNAREDHIEALHDKYDNDFRSGYPHDQPTIDFLKTHLQEHGELPGETRTSWNTAKRLQNEHQQEGLDSF